MPALNAVAQVMAFSASPGGPAYQVLRTIEFDAYESSAATAAVARVLQAGPPSPRAISDALRAAAPPPGENFTGNARAAAKLSVGTGPIEHFANASALISSLPSDQSMIHHQPPIDTASTSGRLAEERRNIRVVAFLYAASREADNDFHLIVGRDPAAPPEMYMTMEVSGLPPGSSPAWQKLKSARDAFQTFFGAHVPQLTYDFYHPPIPVVIDGSVFFDITHALGRAPGPPSLRSRMPTLWEIHPVTAITLGAINVDTVVAPQPEQYTILHTTETDADDDTS